jgi:hypothetical protein
MQELEERRAWFHFLVSKSFVLKHVTRTPLPCLSTLASCLCAFAPYGNGCPVDLVTSCLLLEASISLMFHEPVSLFVGFCRLLSKRRQHGARRSLELSP